MTKKDKMFHASPDEVLSFLVNSLFFETYLSYFFEVILFIFIIRCKIILYDKISWLTVAKIEQKPLKNLPFSKILCQKGGHLALFANFHNDENPLQKGPI